MGEDLQPTSNAPISQEEANRWAMFCHLGGLAWYIGVPLGGVVIPLVIWLLKRNEHPFIDDQGKEAVNFQINMMIYGIICTLLLFVLIGWLLFPLLVIYAIVCTIIAMVRSSKGEAYRYPFTIRFLN